MEAFNVKFVGAVERNRVLYDSTLIEYSRKDLTDKAWHEVAAEFELSVSECKERWKNLRTAFLRRLKDSGSKAKKAYYLHEALQFILPFTKASHLATGNLSEHSQVIKSTNPEDSLVSTPAYTESTDWLPLSPSPTAPSVASTPSLCTSFVEYSMPEDHEQADNSPESRQLSYFKSSSISRNQLSGKKRKISSSESEADRAIAEYYAAKKNTLPSNNERKEAILQFMNSLVPDLMTLTDPQLRSFKRRTLFLIDEVTGIAHLEESYCRPCYTDFPCERVTEISSPASAFSDSSTTTTLHIKME